MTKPMTDKRRAEIETVRNRLDTYGGRPFDYELRAAMRDLTAEAERLREEVSSLVAAVTAARDRHWKDVNAADRRTLVLQNKLAGYDEWGNPLPPKAIK